MILNTVLENIHNQTCKITTQSKERKLKLFHQQYKRRTPKALQNGHFIGRTGDIIKIKIYIKDKNKSLRGRHVDTSFGPSLSRFRSWHAFDQGILVQLILIKEI